LPAKAASLALQFSPPRCAIDCPACFPVLRSVSGVESVCACAPAKELDNGTLASRGEQVFFCLHRPGAWIFPTRNRLLFLKYLENQGREERAWGLRSTEAAINPPIHCWPAFLCVLAGLRTRRCRKYATPGMSFLAGYLPTVRLRVLLKLSKHLS